MHDLESPHTLPNHELLNYPYAIYINKILFGSSLKFSNKNYKWAFWFYKTAPMEKINYKICHLYYLVRTEKPPRLASETTSSKPTNLQFAPVTAGTTTGTGFPWTGFVVRRYGANHLFCMYRFFLHGGTESPMLLRHRFATSHMAWTVRFSSSAVPTKTLGREHRNSVYLLVGRAISNWAAKSMSTKYRFCHSDELDWTTSMNS